MKKTFNINLSGYGFVIDEDAYDILETYLNTLTQVCEKASQPETAGDIEQRIAEIFNERAALSGPRILCRADVEEVIGRMGAPEEIVDVEADCVSPDAGPASPPGGPQVPPVTPPPFVGNSASKPGFWQKRLYRDVDNRVLGGVCSGLAWYLGIDVVWVRIIMVVLAFLSGSTMVFIYIILWIVVPAAKSPYERMQMMGINPSMQNVGRVVTGQYDPSSPESQRASGGSEVANNVGRVILMLLTVLGLIIVGSLLFAFSLGFLGCLIALCISNSQYHDVDIVQTKLILGCVMGGMLVLGIPLFLLFRWLLGLLTEREFLPLSLPARMCLIVPWLLGVAACIACGILL